MSEKPFPSSMPCFVYRSNNKREMYLYVAEKYKFSTVPESLLKMMGTLEFSFEFELNIEKKLLRYEAKEVMRNLIDNGFFLQMPPDGYKSYDSGDAEVGGVQGF